MSKSAIIFILITGLVTATALATNTVIAQRQKVEELTVQAQEQKETIQELENELAEAKEARDYHARKHHEYQAEAQGLQDQVERIDKLFKDIFTVRATAYAPLDPQTEEGMCYEGDPGITASGRPVEPGKTMAAGPELPFGTRVLVEGHGERVVQDRGGAIGNGRIDLATESRAEAFRIGNREKKALIIPREK